MAVYTEVSDDELAAFVASYDLGALLSYKGIAEGVENTNYLVHTEKGPFFLTLYEKRVAPARSAVLPRPDGASGARPASTARRRCTMRRAACCARWPAGRPRSSPSSRACGSGGRSRATAWRVGEALAGCIWPARASRMKRANALGLAGWRPLYRAVPARAPTRSRRGWPPPSSRSSTIWKRNWPTDLPQGVIHADLFPDNVFFLGDKLSGLIDFYFACNDALAYDVAIALNAWCFESDHAFNITKGQALLKGYQSVRAARRRRA